MKIKFKRQSYQTNAVEAVADCFLGQLQSTGIQYRIDPGVQKSVPQQSFKDFDEIAGFRNRDLTLNSAQILQNVQVVQRRQSLPESSSLVESNVCKVNLDIEMETGTGKTYCYIKSMFELHKRFGWSKFIVVVPSIAIREGVKKSFELTGEHFLEEYGKRARVFIYDSKQLHNLESFSSDGGINVMIINVQAFNATGRDNRRIYEELDDFQSRKPIDVISANRPIVILDELSNKLDQYKGFVISDIDARTNTVSFTNGVELQAGDATGDVSESTLRRIQIREAIRAHFEKEQVLFSKGIKVLSLFFIDEVAKYRQYDETGELRGEYAEIFEDEYIKQRDENLTMFGDAYDKYLKAIDPTKTHNGYFSIDKKTSRLVDPAFKKTGEGKGETDDVDAYDLILKDKERLLSFEEPVRFIFSHSALREGWDNPNVFVICTLKHSDNTISRRQEVGRGMRLSVNQNGDRMDDPATVHQVNVLTVVASESYKDFVSALQRDISESLSARPRAATKEFFTGKILKSPTGDVQVTPQMANQIFRYLNKHEYTDDSDRITQTYHDAKKEGSLAPLPPELVLQAEQIYLLIDSVFSEAQLPDISDERASKTNPLNSNFDKKEFQELWHRINHKAVYTVHFDTSELIGKCIRTLNKELNVSPLQYTIQRGEQKDSTSFDEMKQGAAFQVKETVTDSHNESIQSNVKYDLIGKFTEATQLTRRTIADILGGTEPSTFKQYQINPEDFILKACKLINEQKATVIVEHLAYDMIEDRHDADIFTRDKPKEDFSKAFEAKRHIYDYVFTDSTNERNFVEELDTSVEVVVYAKLPKTFFIPTPVGNYNPDWAIAFEEGKVKHIYFIAETKGSMSSMELRNIEECKIDCARKFFKKITSDQVKYDVVNNYGKLMELVK